MISQLPQTYLYDETSGPYWAYVWLLKLLQGYFSPYITLLM